MPQFTVNLDTFGNITVESGVVIDVTGMFPAIHYLKNSNSFQGSSSSSGATRWQPNFCGGSGRNIYLEKTPSNNNIPHGFYSLSEDLVWKGENQTPFSWSMDPDTYQISLLDFDGNPLAESDPGAFNPYGQIACSSLLANGQLGSYYYEVDLGDSTGSVVLTYDAYSVPDRFIVDYNGSTVIDTGFRGTSGTYVDLDGNSVVVTVAGPGAGTASFTKTTASPRIATVKVIAPYFGTAWQCTLGCPGTSLPPYIPVASTESPTIPFSATTTTLGATLFGGAATLNAWYEGNKTKGNVNTTTLEAIPIRRTTIYFTSDSEIGGSLDIGGEWTERRFQYWASDSSVFDFTILPDGTAQFSDGTDIVATRSSVSLLDASGAYDSTEYGADTYNSNQTFKVAATMHNNAPMRDMIVYMTINTNVSGVVDITGPFSDFQMPTNEANKKHIPLAMIHEDLSIDQLSEGSIIWNQANWGSIQGTLSHQSDLQDALDSKIELVEWGSIEGDLADQSDLQAALDSKVDI